jgi:dipeptidyl aminopeptidase/acylaminoacyl peptidase
LARLIRKWITIGIALGAFPALAAPPTADFFKDFQYPEMEISPNGRYIAALVPLSDTINLAIIDREEKTNHAITRYPLPAKVLEFHWKSDDQLLYVSKNIGSLGNIHMHALSAIARNGDDMHLISQYVNATDGIYFSNLVDLLPEVPGKVLMAYASSGSDYPAVHEEWISSKSGATTKTGIAGGRDCLYLVDRAGDARVCLSTEIDFSRRLNFRNKNELTWKTLKIISKDDGLFLPIAFTADNQALYVLSNLNRDTIALFEFNPISRILSEVLVEVPGVDLDRGIFSRDGRTLIGVHYITDRSHVYYLDDHIATIQKSMEAAFPQEQISIISQSNEGHAIIKVANDQTPGRYYLFTDATHAVESIGEQAPWIDATQMAWQKAIKINTRDNLVLRGYLNLPRGRASKNLPLVVIPSGGPDSPATGGWAPIAQFFASRGYAVLRVNIRGSSGYGRAFRAAGQHQAAAEVQNDIADSIAWAVSEGIIDKARVAIFGSNYGGYAALMSMVANPDAFRCGISYGGELNLEHLFSGRVVTASYHRYRSREEMAFWEDMVGNHRDVDYLRKESPMYNVGKIRAPVFLAYSEDDFLMPFSDAKQMRDTLKNAGKPVEFLAKSNEPHLFESTANKTELFTQIDAFLQKCNPAD